MWHRISWRQSVKHRFRRIQPTLLCWSIPRTTFLWYLWSA
nr:MAG TPA: hypothetical protein [Caudoviricetes sp.]